MRKIYGASRVDNCPFCGQRAVTENAQGVPVCIKHKKSMLDLKCQCGSWLDVLKGKYGPYCRCLNCGNVNFRRALEMNPRIEDASTNTSTERPKKSTKSNYKSNYKKTRSEQTVTSDEVDLYFS